MAVTLASALSRGLEQYSGAYSSMSRWDEGIKAAEEALRWKPDYQLARNNLAWARAQREKQKSGGGR
jgi:hypothetical protein